MDRKLQTTLSQRYFPTGKFLASLAVSFLFKCSNIRILLPLEKKLYICNSHQFSMDERCCVHRIGISYWVWIIKSFNDTICMDWDLTSVLSYVQNEPISIIKKNTYAEWEHRHSKFFDKEGTNPCFDLLQLLCTSYQIQICVYLDPDSDVVWDQTHLPENRSIRKSTLK